MKYVLLLAMLLSISAFSTQPMDERTAQNALPQSHDSLWKKLGACTVHLDPKKFAYSIHFTEEVTAMKGQEIRVSGFMLPLEATEKFSHFLLSKRTPTCAFCMPGEPNEIIEIFSRKPVSWEEGMVTVSGILHFTNNPESGLFFQLKDSALVK